MSTNRKSPDVSGEASGRVVVGVHGSRSSLRALRHAVHIALDRGWDLEIVTAWPDADDPLIHDVPGRYIAARGHAVESQREALATLDPVVAADLADVPGQRATRRSAHRSMRRHRPAGRRRRAA